MAVARPLPATTREGDPDAEPRTDGRHRDPAERGATGLEYVGLVLLAAIVLGFLWSVLGASDLPGKVAGAVTRILTGS